MGISISGMYSGMDIDGIVTELMQAARQPLDRLNQSKTKYEWQRDLYREINKGAQELSQKIFDGISMEKNLLARKGTSSNESAISVTPLAGSNQESVMMTVSQLANAKSYVGNNTVANITDKIVSDGVLKFKATDGEGKESKEIQIEYKKDETLEQVLSRINQNKDLNVSAFYDSGTQKVVLTARDTGSKTELEIMDQDTAAFMEKFGFDGLSANQKLSDSTLSFQLADTGKDAKFTINGYQTTRTSNNFTINGMSYSLKQVTAPGEVVTLSTSHDVDKAVDTIKDFVDSYNALIATMNSVVKEKQNRDYAPLTDEQKKEMTEDQIEKWEAKAKSGILRGDMTIRSAFDEMRNDLSRAVGGVTLSQFGITTSSKWNEEPGKLIIDEEKLREALAKDPEAVYNAFNAKTSTEISVKSRWDRTASEQTKFENETGFAGRLRDALSNLSYNIEKKAGNDTSVLNSYSIGKSIVDIDKKIEALEERLENLQTRYYNQFAAMEQAMQKAESQSSYISSLFSSYA